MALCKVTDKIPENHWVKFYRENPGLCKSLVFSRALLTESPLVIEHQYQEVIRGLVGKMDCLKVDHPVALVTYTGFHFQPLGLLFRNLVEKEFLPVYDMVPAFYASRGFDFNYERFKFGNTIVLVEGILDAEAFSALTGYPYVISYLTSAVSGALAGFLGTITDKVIIVPDTDKWGMKNVEQSSRNLTACKVRFKVLELPRTDIDVYDFYEEGSPQEKSCFLTKFKTMI